MTHKEWTDKMAMYICIRDEGGRNPTCPDMSYHQPAQHLIRSEELLTNDDIRELLNVHRKTHKGVRLVGVWSEDETLDYADIKSRIEQ